MVKQKIRAIVDTNIWIHFALADKVEEFILLFSKSNVELIFSNLLLYEIYSSFDKPKLSGKLPVDIKEQIRNSVFLLGEIHPVSSVVKVCRDPDDNFLLELALDSNAQFIVTGDKDLLILQSFRKTKILSLRNFLEILIN